MIYRVLWKVKETQRPVKCFHLLFSLWTRESSMLRLMLLEVVHFERFFVSDWSCRINPVIHKDLSLKAAADRVESELTLVNIEDLLDGVSTDRKYLLCTVYIRKKIEAITPKLIMKNVKNTRQHLRALYYSA